VKAYGLGPFHKTGAIYTGKTLLLQVQGRKVQWRTTILEHIVALKSTGNRVGMLTGRGTLLLADFQ
jgi:hypothetical protein